MPSAMSKPMQAALFAGMLSAALFVSVYAIGLGFIFMFLPTLPLFFAGLRYGHGVAMRAGTVASILIVVIVGVASSLVYMLVLWLPSWGMVRSALRFQSASGSKEAQWYPLGLIMANLSLYAISFIAFMTVYYAGTPGGLPGLMTEHLETSIKTLEAEYGEAMGMLASQSAFLIFPSSIWLWAICMYGHIWLAAKLMAQKGLGIRQSMAVTPFEMPGWILYLLAVSALASIIGGHSMQFLGKSSVIILLLPYFFSGLALLHYQSSSWPNRRFLLFLVYFLIFAQVWPALIIAGIGLWQQLKTLNKHLPRGGNSSNN